MDVDVKEFVNNFLDKNNGRAARLSEFPSLFAMQGHTGAFGVIFMIGWFLSASYFLPTLWPNGGIKLGLFAGGIFVIYFLLSWGSFFLGNHFAKRIEELKFVPPAEVPMNEQKLDVRVREWMTFLSMSYVIACCLLIWLTGGAASPFVPFYVMIFTLTIERNKVPTPGVYVLAYFLLAIVLSCVVAEIWPSPIDKSDMLKIQQSGFQITIHTIFIGFSLVVPTLSMYFVELNKRRAQPAAGGQ